MTPPKLIIQIPCYNEAETLRTTVEALPRSIPGVGSVEVLIIDDGSADETVRVARECGVDHIVAHSHNLGLAKAFMTGIKAGLGKGADLIVNTDADNQYCADDIPKLVQPILEGRADMVIGTRPIGKIKHFSPIKKMLQWLGSWFVRRSSGVHVEDAPSGFRAFSRAAALKMNVFTDYTYTLETIIQAGREGMAVVCVPIRVNGDLRPSRLVKSIPSYISQSILTVFRIVIVYHPLRNFLFAGWLLITAGILIGARFLVYYFMGDGEGKIQSLILAAIFIGLGFQTCVLGVLADLISVNRRLLQEMQGTVRDLHAEPQGKSMEKQPASDS